MSATPRTDAKAREQSLDGRMMSEDVSADFARELELENARLRDALRSEGDAEHARWVEAAEWKMRAERYQKALEWCRDTNACDFEYRKVAADALANIGMSHGEDGPRQKL